MVGTSIAIKDDFDQSPDECEESSRESFYHLWEYIRYQQNIGDHLNVKEGPGDVSEGNEEHLTRNWKKGDLCYKVAENIAELGSILAEK